VAPGPPRLPAGKDENESVSENVLAVLTDQERKITRLVAQGLSNKAVARQLNVSPGTIKVRLNHIFQKLGINDRTEWRFRRGHRNRRVDAFRAWHNTGERGG
jgi:DNA-binding NarL/FixJ family response regulator